MSRVSTADGYQEFLSGYEPSTPETTSIASSASSVLLLARNPDRKAASINNQSESTLYIGFENPVTAANSFLAMSPGSFLMLDRQVFIAGSVYGVWDAADGFAQVTSFA